MLEFLLRLIEDAANSPFAIQFGGDPQLYALEDVDAHGIVVYKVNRYEDPPELRPWTSVTRILIIYGDHRQ